MDFATFSAVERALIAEELIIISGTISSSSKIFPIRGASRLPRLFKGRSWSDNPADSQLDLP